MAKKHRPSPFQLRGKLLAYNLSPKGAIEGALIETGDGLAQLNFYAKHVEHLAHRLPIGGELVVDVEVEHEDGDHPVYRATADADQAYGTIVRFNYALHGEINGYHLDEGTFVHVKPGGARKYKLRIGSKIKATGERRAGPDGEVLEAEDVAVEGKRAKA